MCLVDLVSGSWITSEGQAPAQSNWLRHQPGPGPGLGRVRPAGQSVGRLPGASRARPGRGLGEIDPLAGGDRGRRLDAPVLRVDQLGRGLAACDRACSASRAGCSSWARNLIWTITLIQVTALIIAAFRQTNRTLGEMEREDQDHELLQLPVRVVSVRTCSRRCDPRGHEPGCLSRTGSSTASTPRPSIGGRLGCRRGAAREATWAAGSGRSPPGRKLPRSSPRSCASRYSMHSWTTSSGADAPAVIRTVSTFSNQLSPDLGDAVDQVRRDAHATRRSPPAAGCSSCSGCPAPAPGRPARPARARPPGDSAWRSRCRPWAGWRSAGNFFRSAAMTTLASSTLRVVWVR